MRRTSEKTDDAKRLEKDRALATDEKLATLLSNELHDIHATIETRSTPLPPSS